MFLLKFIQEFIELLRIDTSRSVYLLDGFLKSSLKYDKTQGKCVTFNLIMRVSINFVLSQILINYRGYIQGFSLGQFFILNSLYWNLPLSEEQQFKLLRRGDKNTLRIDIPMRDSLFLQESIGFDHMIQQISQVLCLLSHLLLLIKILLILTF